MVERQPSKLNVASSSLVSRSSYLSGERSRTGPSSSGVERILGKDEVAGSNPALGSRFFEISNLRFGISDFESAIFLKISNLEFEI